MSTKIYEAWRFPRGRLDEFVLRFNDICRRAVAKEIKTIQNNVKPSKIAEVRREVFGKNLGVSKRCNDRQIALIWILSEWMMASKRPEKSILDFDCSFNLWMDRRWCYVILYVPSWCIKMKKLLPKWCEFYGYWDNTDPQAGVSEKSWRARRDAWEKVVLRDWDRTRFTHVTFEMEVPDLIGLESLLKHMKIESDMTGHIMMAASLIYWDVQKKEKTSKRERV